jgi:1-aminocyclopropane-1-carboxylate deaminase/D-cysteine desulfhydrase-like pyridoxal-dependent ACC family enzyme
VPTAGERMTDRRRARELFARYPGTTSLPWTEFATLPTPTTRSNALSSACGADVWVKRDDLSGDVYGGNKVRKLEFLLADALARGASDVITFGAAGSNHALATAVYGGRLGLSVHSMLVPQPNARYVARNLEVAAASGARLHHHADPAHAVRAAARLRASLRERTGREPYVIPFGGTNPLSTAGFVSAGLELATQVEYRELPEPDLVFVALGSMGTAAGLAIGMRAGGLRSRLVAVPVVSYEMNTPEALAAAIDSAHVLVSGADPTFPRSAPGTDDFDVAAGYLGEEYARFTPAGMEAVRLADEDGLRFEGTYTGKAASAMIAMGREGKLRGKRVLFWNTYNSRDITPPVLDGGAARVPPRMRRYATGDVQELDV